MPEVCSDWRHGTGEAAGPQIARDVTVSKRGCAHVLLAKTSRPAALIACGGKAGFLADVGWRFLPSGAEYVGGSAGGLPPAPRKGGGGISSEFSARRR